MGVREVASTSPAVFFDRDGVLNAAVVRDARPYPPTSVEQARLTPGAPQDVERLRVRGYRILVVTNQPDVARGTTRRETVEAINDWLGAALPIDRFYVCYHDGDDCECRKPKPGLLLKGASEFSIDLSKSWLVGDRWRDIAAGRAAGVRTVFIDHSYAEPFRSDPADFRVTSLTAAVDRILQET